MATLHLVTVTEVGDVLVLSVDGSVTQRAYRLKEDVRKGGNLCTSREQDALVYVLDDDKLVRLHLHQSRIDLWPLAPHFSSDEHDEIYGLFGASHEWVLLWGGTGPYKVDVDPLHIHPLGHEAMLDAMLIGQEDRLLLLSAGANLIEATLTGSVRNTWKLPVRADRLGGLLSGERAVVSSKDVHVVDLASVHPDAVALGGHCPAALADGTILFMKGEGELWQWSEGASASLVASRSEIPRFARRGSYARKPVVSEDGRWIVWWWEGPLQQPHTEILDRQTGRSQEVPYSTAAGWLML